MATAENSRVPRPGWLVASDPQTVQSINARRYDF